MGQKKLYFIAAFLFLAGIALIFWPRSSEVTTESPPVQATEPAPQTETADPSAPQPAPAQPAATSPSQNSAPAQPTQPIPASPEVVKMRKEVEKSLMSGYSALQAMQSEYGRYSTDLNVIGFTPTQIDNQKPLDFKVGFLKPFIPTEPTAGLEASENPQAMTSDIYMNPPNAAEASPDWVPPSYSEQAKNINLDSYAKYCKNGCTADKEHFEMIVVLPLGNGKVDVWLMDETKKLTHVCDGLAKDC